MLLKMPTISIDTFFACSLMVLLVISAMAGASKLLYPHINNTVDMNIAERYASVSKYLLLNDGTPLNWGQNCQGVPETLGLAKAGSDNPYTLDIDKVSRLNNENLYAVSYAQIFTAFEMPDVSFRIEIEPVFEVALNLTEGFEGANKTSYEFEILTEKQGFPVQAELKFYVIAENYLETSHACVSNGRTYVNVTISNDVNGPALLVVFARSVSNAKIVSFSAYPFAHNSPEPKPKGTFLRLGPLNCTLNASLIYPGKNLSDAYALSFNYSSTLTQTANSSQSVTYNIPHFLDPSPTLIVVTGRNSTSFFTEWTAYPQIPLQTGANFASSTVLSNVFAYTYLVTIDSALYKCTVWLGGPRQ
jgi:hypothetical protein